MTASFKLDDFSFKKQKLALFLLAFALVFIAFFGGLEDIVVRWNKQEEYGHGFFLPLISLWFLWNRKEAIVEAVGKAAWSGLYFILIGMFALILGEVTAIYVFIQLGFIVTLFGLILSFGGKELFKVTFVPVAFLVFAIPLPYFLEAVLTARLQLTSSQLGVAVLRALNTSVYLEGNVIDLGQYKLQVVEACSGLRYLYPLLSISFLIAYMYKATFVKRAFVFITAIPITVLMNSLRIAVVGLLVDQWGPSMADGFLHYFEGWIIFMLCLGILLGEVWFFEYLGEKRKLLNVIDVPIIKPLKANQLQTGINYPLLVTMTLLLVAILMVKLNDGRAEIHPQRQSLVKFPLKLGDWSATESSLSTGELKLLALDDYVLADYQKAKEGGINFYVAYYASQRKGASPHSPQVCMPGGGWNITSLERVMLQGEDTKLFEANRVVIQKGNQRQLVYYWFEQRGRRIASEYWMKWFLLKDSIQMNRTDGALVRIVAPSPLTEPIGVADARLKEFMKLAMPELNKFVPK